MDFKSFGDGKAPNTSSTSNGERWWAAGSATAAAGAVSAELTTLKDQQDRRLAQHMVSARLYGNLSVLGLGGMTFSRASTTATASRDRISYNVVQSCVDTLQSKMSKNKPKPLFLTSGGDYKVQRKAKKLNQFIDGVFYETQAHANGIEVFRDGEVFGDGLTHVFEKNGRVAHERVLSSELYVDEIEARYGKPRRMHWVRPVDRSVLMEAFSGHRSDIATATATREPGDAQMTVSDMVMVRESWHLPSGPDAKDGKHLISIEGCALTPLESWEHDFFPFARFQWCPRLMGYWSQGGVEQIQNIQLEINKLLWVIQRSFHLGGSFKVFLDVASKIVTEHINNDVGAVIRHTGPTPQYVIPPMVQPEIFQHLSTLKQSAYEQFGISSMNATSTKPAGLNSGKALREFDDIGTDRFLTPGQRYQNYYLELAKLDIATIKDIAAANKGHYEVKVPGKKFLRTVDWADIDLAEEEYVMQCFPVSSLPTDPTGRLQTIQEYAQAGYLSPRTAKKLLDFPDLEQVESLQNAEEEYLTEILEKMVDEGIYTPPEPFDDLRLADELAHQEYALGKQQNLDEDKLDLLRQFMGQVGQLQQMAMPPAPMGAPGAPAGAPMPTQQSDLIPNTAAPTLQ